MATLLAYSSCPRLPLDTSTVFRSCRPLRTRYVVKCGSPEHGTNDSSIGSGNGTSDSDSTGGNNNEHGSTSSNSSTTGSGHGSVSSEPKEGVRVEVSSSVMKVLQREGTSSNNESLIEANLRKRKQQQQPRKTRDEAALEATIELVKKELFGSVDACFPKHDALFPLVVAATVVFIDESRDADQALERFLDTSILRSAVAHDLERMQAVGMLPSQLFCDINGEPMNQRGNDDLKFERWFLLSMYVKFKLWWAGPSMPSQIGQEYAYRMSNFVFDSTDHLLNGFELKRRVASRYGKLFVGKLLTEPKDFLEKLQSELDKQQSGRAAVLLTLRGEEAAAGEVGCLVTHRTSVPFLQVRGGAQWFCYLLLVWAATSASFSFQPVVGQRSWEELVVGTTMVGVLGSGILMRKVVAAIHGVSRLLSAPPLVLPVGQHGAFPSCLAYYRGCLPSRACLLDLSAASSVASLATAAVFLFDSSFNVRLSDDLGGCLLVPSDLFSYSPVLTWLLDKVSVVAAAEGSSSLVLHPLALGGLLGLNLTVFSLLPMANLDGGRILAALCGRQAMTIVSGATFLLLAVVLLASQKFLLASVWAASFLLVPEDSFQRDEVSEPGLLRTALGFLLLLSALLCFVPGTF